ncbi:MAG: barstar family protein [Saccharofermentans sp.]|nr:barstar family protein [Saccharofermentans sp.]
MDKNTVMIDLSQLETVADIHELLRYKLGLPEYYGGNLDALHDVLTSTSSLHLILYGTDDTYRCISEYLPKLQKVMEDSSASNPNFSYELR